LLRSICSACLNFSTEFFYAYEPVTVAAAVTLADTGKVSLDDEDCEHRDAAD